MTGKSPDAFRTISEVADWLDRPAHVLRFWESKFTQVKPVKRAGGRRYYRPEDMRLLGGIKKLLHDDGMTIKGAQKVLREQGVRYVSALSQPLDDDGALTNVATLQQTGVANVDTAPEPGATPQAKPEAAHDAEQSLTPAATAAPEPPAPPAAEHAPDAPAELPADDAGAGSASEAATPADQEPGDAPLIPFAAEDPPAQTAKPDSRPAPSGPVALDVPARDATSPDTPQATQAPPADAPAAAPKAARRPLGADLPPPPDVSALRGAPGLLSRIAALKGPVAPEKQAEIAALVDRLAALRDRMASARKG